MASSPTEQAQAGATTAAFRSATTADAGRLVTDVGRLGHALDRGDLGAAQDAQMAAQADFDEIRFVDAASPQNVASLDDLEGQVLPGATFGGIHALERDLWAGGDAADDLPSLQAQASVAAELVGKQSLSPAVIAGMAASQLGWVADVAVPAREEPYSHDDVVDVAAGVAAARQAFDALQPLACSIDVAGCRAAAANLDSLGRSVVTLGPPTQASDAQLTTAVQRTLVEQADRAADAVVRLESSLLPFGTAGPEPYGDTAGGR